MFSAVCACVASLYCDVGYEYVGFTSLNLTCLRRAPCCVVDFEYRDFVRTLGCVALLCCLLRLTSRSACVLDACVVLLSPCSCALFLSVLGRDADVWSNFYSVSH